MKRTDDYQPANETGASTILADPEGHGRYGNLPVRRARRLCDTATKDDLS